MNQCLRSRELLPALFATLVAGSAPAFAGQVLTAIEMETFLSDSLILEDFEGVNLQGGTTFPVANPLDHNTFSFFTIEPGVTYTSTVSLSFFGTFIGGQDSVILRGESDLTLTFNEPQAGVGFLLFGSTDVVFYNGADALGAPALSGGSFVGWADTTVGITSVRITTTPGAIVSIDDMMFGAVVNPACPTDLNFDGQMDTADLGVLINVFGTGNTAGDINNDGVVDTADLGLLLSVFGADCP